MDAVTHAIPIKPFQYTWLELLLNNLFLVTAVVGCLVLLSFIIPRLGVWSLQVTLAIGLVINLIGTSMRSTVLYLRALDGNTEADLTGWIQVLGSTTFGSGLATLGLLIALHPLVRTIWGNSWFIVIIPSIAIALFMTYTAS